MINKIRYRIVFNRANRLNKRGEGLIHIEMTLNRHSCYVSTHIYVEPKSFKNGLIVSHTNANYLNAMLIKMKNEIELIEMGFFIKNSTPTLQMLKLAITESLAPSSKLIDFARNAIKNSDRKKQTLDGYETLFNNLEKFKNNILVSDIDYNFITKYDNWLKNSNISHNTRVGRLRQLKAIMNEAVKRNVITQNPFDNFKIPQMINKKGYLTEEQLRLIEELNITDKKTQYVKDAFLFCCYSGLRISDLLTLKSENINNDGWIHKKTIKTQKPIHVPISQVFDGKALKIIEKYSTIEKLVNKLGKNNEINKLLKPIFEKVGAPKTYTFHTSRHTFASLLLNRGIPITSIQKMLGHTKLSTTQIYGEVTQETIELDLMRSIKNNTSK